MTTTIQKQEILRSLSSLDSVQAEQVLNFINRLVRPQGRDLYQQYLKRKAMQEIERALREVQLGV